MKRVKKVVSNIILIVGYVILCAVVIGASILLETNTSAKYLQNPYHGFVESAG